LFLGAVVSLLLIITLFCLPVNRAQWSYGLGGVLTDLKDGYKN